MQKKRNNTTFAGMQSWSENIRGKILVCPLNWGLGHATRCIPLIEQLLQEGNEVVIAADGHPLALLRQAYPQLNWIEWPSYCIRYSASSSQVGAMLRSAIPILRGIISEHRKLHKLLNHQHFDAVLSDNRFGMFSRQTYCVYMTHQLMIKMPERLKRLEPIVHSLHRFVLSKYAMCLVPDYAGSENLAGDLAHQYPALSHTRFIGPLSRFQGIQCQPNPDYTVVALISGPEPTRTLFEESIIARYAHQSISILVVRGLPADDPEPYSKANMHFVAHLPDHQLAAYLLGATTILCRSGYSTIMDLHALQCLHKAQFSPTPGQTEQEYLAEWHNHRKKAVSLQLV